jgi:hypothetical protein
MNRVIAAVLATLLSLGCTVDLVDIDSGPTLLNVGVNAREWTTDRVALNGHLIVGRSRDGLQHEITDPALRVSSTSLLPVTRQEGGAQVLAWQGSVPLDVSRGLAIEPPKLEGVDSPIAGTYRLRRALLDSVTWTEGSDLVLELVSPALEEPEPTMAGTSLRVMGWRRDGFVVAAERSDLVSLSNSIRIPRALFPGVGMDSVRISLFSVRDFKSSSSSRDYEASIKFFEEFSWMVKTVPGM